MNLELTDLVRLGGQGILWDYLISASELGLYVGAGDKIQVFEFCKASTLPKKPSSQPLPMNQLIIKDASY